MAKFKDYMEIAKNETRLPDTFGAFKSCYIFPEHVLLKSYHRGQSIKPAKNFNLKKELTENLIKLGLQTPQLCKIYTVKEHADKKIFYSSQLHSHADVQFPLCANPYLYNSLDDLEEDCSKTLYSNYEFQNRAPGTPVGISHYSFKKFFQSYFPDEQNPNALTLSKERNKYSIAMQKRILKCSTEHFVDFLKQYKLAYNLGLLKDSHSNNFTYSNVSGFWFLDMHFDELYNKKTLDDIKSMLSTDSDDFLIVKDLLQHTFNYTSSISFDYEMLVYGQLLKDKVLKFCEAADINLHKVIKNNFHSKDIRKDTITFNSTDFDDLIAALNGDSAIEEQVREKYEIENNLFDVVDGKFLFSYLQHEKNKSSQICTPRDNDMIYFKEDNDNVEKLSPQGDTLNK